MKSFTDKDKSLVMDAAIALEYALHEASENGVDIGLALGHAQAILAELSNAGFSPNYERFEPLCR